MRLENDTELIEIETRFARTFKTPKGAILKTTIVLPSAPLTPTFSASLFASITESDSHEISKGRGI
jgi:hypothetical protein